MTSEIDDETKSLSWDLDEVLSELGLGTYQIRNFILIGLLLMFSNIFPLSFTLTAGDLEYRCKIPECDTTTDSPFRPGWLSNAIPFKQSEPRKCERYAPAVSNSANYTGCSTELFNRSNIQKCDELLFATNERTIVNEFGILCEEQVWLLPLVGTVNSIGQFAGIPLFGIISDKYGRKCVALICAMISSFFGLLRAVSSCYPMFLICEFLDSFFSSGIYGPAFILGLELVNPGLRATASTIIGLFYPFGAVIMGLVAWWIQDWRKMLLICYTPGILFLSYFWFIPESVRWLEMKGRHNEAVRIIKKISIANNKTLSDGAIHSIKCISKSSEINPELNNDNNRWVLLKNAFRSKSILMRVLNCSFCWFANTLVYYGLSINSVQLVGNKFINFILVNLIEVPAFVVSGLIMDKISRKFSQSAAFILSGIGCIICEFIPTEAVILHVVMFLLSKFMITISYNILYVYSAEIFPTELRLSLFGLSSMFGRTGSMLAPQTILLSQYAGKHAPVFLFGAISLVAGVLSTFFPETFRRKLPDTINETKIAAFRTKNLDFR